ncbi:Rhamnan synthesis protein F [Yoonia tamlensis]|uniref:Rhamnan synthesis protein F n=1 Tax=Yoonia tamlensis TaxID=390270 RepID=A0A1I6G9H1_9RHOB|nr:rhamnan synthesis F family protein [Yoonia tamlensis]SFR38856.1 Rhamnan synthesis protein F [Yoonia tamlensis]
MSDAIVVLPAKPLGQTANYVLILLANYVAFYVLSLLSWMILPVSQRASRRFARSAAKRNPKLATPKNIAAILAANAFQPEFCFGARGSTMSRVTAARTYLSHSHSGVDPRKPEPGFHPQLFAQALAPELNELDDPYVKFLQLGRPAGDWQFRVIAGGKPMRSNGDANGLCAALHVHAYYIDQLADILGRLNLNRYCPDLFVSVRNDADAMIAREILSRYAGQVKEIAVFPNVGRDIGPMLTGFGPVLIGDYDVIGHVHTKKSLFSKDDAWVTRWVELSLSNTLGSTQAGPMIDRILAAMVKDAQTGMVYPEDPHIPGWGKNAAAAQKIAAQLGAGPLPDAFNFPVGTMFWARADALRPFVELGLTWSDYPKEPIANDGTMLHALERLFGAVPTQKGWKTQVTHTPGIHR